MTTPKVELGFALKKMDKRVTYYLMIDTETANGRFVNGKIDLRDSLVYDLGISIVDKQGRVYWADSLLIYDVIVLEKELMKSAYYANKLPKYRIDYKQGKRRLVNFTTAKQIVSQLCKQWNVRAIIAHNARFDYNALNQTLRYITKSEQRFFLPYGKPLWDTMVMAREVMSTSPSYIAWCKKDPNRMTKHKVPQPRVTAEILYQYISSQPNFIEDHTGLEDTLIEKEIFRYCMAKKKKMRKTAFKEK